MAQYNKVDLATEKDTQYADGGGDGNITPLKHRNMFRDFIDSFLTVLDNFVDEDDMVSNSATKAPSQQSVKAYTDNTFGYRTNYNSSLSTGSVNIGAQMSLPDNSVTIIEVIVLGVRETTAEDGYSARIVTTIINDGGTKTILGTEDADVKGTGDASAITVTVTTGVNTFVVVDDTAEFYQVKVLSRVLGQVLMP